MNHESETIKSAISLLEAYRADLDWWLSQGHDTWVFCTNGTPPFTREEAEQKMPEYIDDVTETIKHLKEIVWVRKNNNFS